MQITWILTCPYGVWCSMCTVHIQPRNRVLDHVDHTAPTRHHELDHTDQLHVCPESLDHQAVIIFRWSLGDL